MKKSFLSFAFLYFIFSFSFMPNLLNAVLWTTPVTLAPLSSNASESKAVVDQAGTVTAVQLGRDIIYVKPIGGSFTLDTSLAGYSINDLSVNSNGDLVASATQFSGPNNQVNVFVKPFGGAWSAPMVVAGSNSLGTGGGVSMNSLGDIAVAWIQNGGTNQLIVSLKYVGDPSFQAPTDVSSPFSSPLTVIMDENRIANVLGDAFGPPDKIISTVAPFGSPWTSITTVASGVDNVGLKYNGIMVADSSGFITAIWGEGGFIKTSTTSGGTNVWSAPVDISIATSNTPTMAIDPSGNITALWKQNNVIVSATKIAGAWGSAVPVSIGTNDVQPGIAVNNAGFAVATWTDIISEDIISSRRTTLNGAWETPVTISFDSPDPSYESTVVLDPSDNATALWNFGSGGYGDGIGLKASETFPQITNVNPNTGTAAGGNSVVLTGSNFIGATAVTFGVTPAVTFTVDSESQITVTAPAGTPNTTVDVRITTPVGTTAITVADQYTYQDPPTVTNVNANSGPIAGGNNVVITGTNFYNVSDVKFGATSATGFTVNTPTQITATVPAGAAGTVDVTVVALAGTSPITVNDEYTYLAPPTVTNVNPAFGPAAGGNSVVITGTNFINVSDVKFGTNSASFTVNTPTQITATAPAGTEGSTVDVTVTTPGGTSAINVNDQYLYIDPPTVTNVNPGFGPTAGGNSVIITGTNFINVSSVLFGAVPAATFTVNNASQITATAPAGTQGSTVDVTVTNTAGTSAITPADQYVYLDPPTVTNVNPNQGPIAGGNSVVITGTNFYQVSAVQFDGVNATTFTVDTPTQITATAPAHVAGTINVTVTTLAGTSASSPADFYTYLNPPTVTNVNPNVGPTAGGNSVVITGTDFIGVSAVKFGAANAASFTVDTPTQITAVAPAGSGPVDVTVTTPGGTSAITPADVYTFQDPPTVTLVSPAFGTAAGGNSVVITGTNFLNVTAVQFGGVNATSFTVNTPTQITATAPAGTEGSTVDVTVTTIAGTSPITPADQYLYLDPPTVTLVAPNIGPAAGGNSVVITGTNFYNVSAVQFGGVNATTFTVNTPTQITATAPAGTEGVTVDVRVTNLAGTSAIVPADQYTYLDAPTVTNVNPSVGPEAGGNNVIITGTNFYQISAVKFGAVNATSFTVDTPTQITAVASAGTEGTTVDVTVTNTIGTSPITPADQYLYLDPPTVTNVNPNAGISAGGTSVIITGTNFINVSAVQFGGVNATTFTVNTPTQITATAPAGTVGTTVDVRVTNPAGTSAIVPADQYTYQDPPTVTNVNPNLGTAAGGNSVVITGTNFINVSAVQFGGVNATTFTVDTPTQITATAPAGTEGSTVDVTVTTNIGTSATSPADQYTYQDPPTVTNVNPNAGLSAGGTSVIITGTNFINVSAVQFGGVNATSFTVNTPTQITATAPAGTVGTTVDVRVTTPAGTSAITVADQYTYQDPPTVTNVNPNVGIAAGGTSVVITGTNFINVSAVKFGAVNATSFTVDTPTQITATAPAGTLGTTVDVTVTTNIGTSATSPADQYTYQDPPTVTNVNPNVGIAAGGTSVVITGTNFINVSTVKFGIVNATSFTVNTPTQITATVPAGTVGTTVDVRVTTPAGTSAIVPADQYTYQDPPTVTNVNPNFGTAAGGNSVVITGTNFINVSAVKFGAVNATSFTVDTPTQITATAPAGTQGTTVDVTVTTNIGTSATSPLDQYTYQDPPTVTLVNPNIGTAAGGNSVVITGTNFFNVSAVKFGAVNAASFTVNTPTQITANAPAGVQGSTVDVTVSTLAGTSAITVADQYTYQDPPTVTNVNPSSGSTVGGNSVIITGTNFYNVSGVNFGGNAAVFTVDTPTQITATAPAGAAGTVDVTVTTVAGTSAITPADQYTYLNLLQPTVTNVNPNVGPAAGGNSVVITGTNFTGATTVNFGGNAATFTVDTPTQITATAPAGTAGTTVDVTVTTPFGTSPITAADQYSYQTAALPTVTNVNPSFGPSAGGNSVIITGTNFVNVTAVQFGGTNATSFIVNNATQITATAPAGTPLATVDVRVTTTAGISPVTVADQYTYIDPPTVTLVNPNIGPTAGGNVVVITGTNFVNVSAVNFGGNAAAFTVNTPTQITATAPAGTTGIVDVTVTNPAGTSSTSVNDQYTYQNPPTVTNVNPNQGVTAGGNSVIITGTNFINVSAVNFGAIPAASFTVNTPSQITATVPAGSAGTVDVRVTTPVGTSATSSADQYTYIAPPTVTLVSPAFGTAAGGNLVTLTGTNFTGATVVKFGATNAPAFTVVNSTTITATAPAGLEGTIVDVTVTTPGGTSATSPADQYLYIDPPTVTNVNPNQGVTAGGNSVVITGTNFINVSAVNFGATPATSFTVNNPTQITATVPAGSAGTVDVTVTNTAGTSATSPADQYTYIAPPTVTLVSPAFGPSAGGNLVTITGTNFTGATVVKFGATNAPAFTVVNSTTITATAPAGLEGTIVDVTVTTPGGTSATSPADQYLYIDPPTVTNVNPNQGVTAGGNSVVITGTNFINVSAVNFGATPATSFTVNSQTQITATVPAGSAGTVDVTVTNTAGTSATSPADQYTYIAPPTVTLVNPAFGPSAGGNLVTITGTNFTGATVVKFGATNAPAFTVVNSTTITATAPAGTFGSIVDVTVTTPGGTSATSPADQYLYIDPPTVTNVNPNTGPLVGGNSVTITGTNFSNVTGVFFGAAPAAGFTVNTINQITATAPAGVAGTVDVTVTTLAGTSPITAADQYTYVAPPTVTNVNPSFGSAAGTNFVTITGTSFNGATAVQFGGVNATSFVVDTNNQITAVAPAGTEGSVVDIRVTTPFGISPITAADQYLYLDPPTVANVNPALGPSAGGNAVVITGTNFYNVSGVNFGATPAVSFIVNTPTQMTAIVPAGVIGTTVDVRVTNLAGTSAITPADQYTYLDAPTVTNVNPSLGPTAGGNTVTITGTNFVNVTTVKFGAANAASFVVNNSTTITAVPQAGSGLVDVTVSNAAGASPISLNDQYTFQDPPTVTNVNPNLGPLGGGNSVVITGTNFIGVTAVKFGVTSALSFIVNSSTKITAIAPAGIGTVDVTVTTPAGTSATTPADQYSYVLQPTVISVTPNFGPAAGGNSVVIAGTNFIGVTAVQFNGTPATSFVVDNIGQITAVAPAGVEGDVVDVTVTTASGGTSPISPGSKYSYIDPPTVTHLNPNAGPLVGGNTIIITGTNFYGVTDVKFGGISSLMFTVNDPTHITATVPAGVGIVSVTVTNGAGTSSSTPASQYTYQAVPSVTNLNPPTGPAAGGNPVIITGTGFVGVSAVMFGTVNATSFIVDSPTQITAVAPPGIEGEVVNVTVTTPGGTSSPVGPDDNYLYLDPPTVTNLNPSNGPLAGGNPVTITGTNFINITSVKFGLNDAISFVVNSPTEIVAIAPPGVGNVDVTVTNDVGTSPITPSTNYVYGVVKPPVIKEVEPDHGSTQGGNQVKIKGNHFTNASSVLFGTTPALSFTVISDKKIIAVAPPGTAGTVNIRVTTPVGTSVITKDDRYTYVKPIQHPHKPRDLQVEQVKNKFLTQTDIVNVLTWKSPEKGPRPVEYRIYRDASLHDRIAVVSANGPLVYEDHNRRPNQRYTYYIVSVDAAGQVSKPASITVRD